MSSLSFLPRIPAYGCFPASSCAHDPVTTIRTRFQRENEVLGSHAIMMDGAEVGLDLEVSAIVSGQTEGT